jgi:hypothetical protein
MTRRKSPAEKRRRLRLEVRHAYQRHFGSTTQREDAAAELGMDLATFRELLEEERLYGFDVEAAPTQGLPDRADSRGSEDDNGRPSSGG